MKKVSVFFRKWICLALAVLLLGVGEGLALPARAASKDILLPEMSKFFGTKYTQAQLTGYSRLLTCTYDKEEGTKPLEEFLTLLQQDRYQLELDSVSDEYPDSYSTATVKDYFFHYTGTSSAIKWIKLKDGTKYHVRVSLYTYTDKDYSAIVYYSHPNFLHRDSGLHYGDLSVKETVPAAYASPDPSEYFGKAEWTADKESRTEYTFVFTDYPALELRTFTQMLKADGARESVSEKYESGNQLIEYTRDNRIAVSMYWFDSYNDLNVIIYHDAWPVEEEAPAGTVLKNGQTVEVQDDALFRVKKGDQVTLYCTYDEAGSEDFQWKLQEGAQAISLDALQRSCKVKATAPGTARIEMVCTYSYEGTNSLTGGPQTKQATKTRVYTLIVE